MNGNVVSEPPIIGGQGGRTKQSMTQPTSFASTSTPLAYTIGLKSDVGQQRSHNEDAASVFALPAYDAAFVVCDGMGGLRAGDVASKEAVRVVEGFLTQHLGGKNGVDDNKTLRAALVAANDAVNALNKPMGATTPTASGSLLAHDAPTQKREGDSPAPASGLMGTTCVAGIVQNNALHLAHAGDSRGYLYRAGQLTRLTEDHSFVAERVKAGDMTEAEARVSRFRNMITRAIGIDATVDPEVQTVPLQPGDTILVCSDGLTTMVEDTDIAQSLHQTYKQAPDKAAMTLIDMANKKGGEDNITVLLLRVLSGDGTQPAPVRLMTTIGAAPAPQQTTRTTTAAPVAVSAPNPNVLDMDAPTPRRRNRGGSSPIASGIVGGAIAILLITALLALSGDLRQRVVRSLMPNGQLPVRTVTVPAVPGTNGTPAPIVTDFATLTYDSPVRFAEFLARGDILTYSRGEGLYFVAGGSGKVASLSKTGQPLHTAATVEIAPAPSGKPVSTRMFATTDAQGNLYLSYTLRKIVEKKAPDGQLLDTIKGFEQPEAIAVDEDGNIYVVDYNTIKICRAHPPQPTPSPSASASAKPAPKASANSNAKAGNKGSTPARK